jgi:hypothetical protein
MEDVTDVKESSNEKKKGIHSVDPGDVHGIYGKDLLGQFGETDRQKSIVHI